VDGVIASGDLPRTLGGGHPCHMFTWTELKRLLERHHCTIEAAAAAACLSTGMSHVLEPVMEREPELWARFVEWELAFCQEPGALDTGTHLIAVVRKKP